MPDLWNECFVPSMGMAPNDFEKMFCHQCRNPVCDRSAGSGLRWLKRIMTQKERLLDNPKFADSRDPKFADIRSVDFPSALREAMKIEISDRRGDWSIPTEEDASQLVAEMRSAPLTHVIVPPAFKPAPPAPAVTVATGAEDEDDGDVVGRILRRHEIAGSGKNVYQVTLLERVVGQPEWMCTCKAFEFGRARPCKHIEYAMSLPVEDEPVVKPAPPGPPPSRFQGPPAPAKTAPPAKPPMQPPASKQPFYPTLGNIPVPSGGVMVDGSAPPPPKDRAGARPPPGASADPWAPLPTKSKPNVVPVGGRVVLGSGKPPGEKT